MQKIKHPWIHARTVHAHTEIHQTFFNNTMPTDTDKKLHVYFYLKMARPTKEEKAQPQTHCQCLAPNTKAISLSIFFYQRSLAFLLGLLFAFSTGAPGLDMP